MNYLTKHKLHLNNAPANKREEKALIINSKQLFRYSTQELSGTAVERCNMLERHAGDNE